MCANFHHQYLSVPLYEISALVSNVQSCKSSDIVSKVAILCEFTFSINSPWWLLQPELSRSTGTKPYRGFPQTLM